MKDDDDDRPKKKIIHEIGQDLALLSVKELQERIALLKEEIARLEASIAEQAGLAQRRRHVLQEVIVLQDHDRHLTARAAARTYIKYSHLNMLLSFLVHYWRASSFWTLSGSCPLCLTPPC